jgi:hypothetical protein
VVLAYEILVDMEAMLVVAEAGLETQTVDGCLSVPAR